MNEIGTVGSCTSWATQQLENISDTARLEAELLLAHVLGVTRATIMAYPERQLAPEPASRLAALVGQRAAGEPLAYLLGHREFFSLDLEVDANVLVPRPETELVVDSVLGLPPGSGATVIDLGTGSGAIALALKQARPDLAVCGVDASAAALAVAARNARRLGLEIRWLLSDWFDGVGSERFDIIVSNPPYVRREIVEQDLALGHEPAVALDGGPDGLAAYRKILGRAAAHLVPGGRLVFEHGFDQRQQLIDLAAASGFELVEVVDDLAGQPRVALFRKAGGD